MQSRRGSLPALLLWACASLGLASPLLAPGTVLAQATVTGQWQTLSTTMPVNPVHAALLRTGRILVVAGSGNDPAETVYRAALLDPATGSVVTQTIDWDLFCNGMTALPDGRVLLTGGTRQYDPYFGLKNTTIFDPATSAFTRVQDMAAGRWYPTNTLLGDGRTAAFSGYLDTGGPNFSVEIYDVASGWGPQSWTPFTPPLYPRMHLLPNGKLFFAGPTPSSHLFDPVAQAWTVNVARTIYDGTRTYGSSVLLPLRAQNAYRPQVMIMGGDNPATDTAEIIDLGSTTPAWRRLPSMSFPRVEMNAILLPNGKVLAIGGSAHDNVASTASLAAEIFDPASETWTVAASATVPRMYHSVAILLPDGRVWTAGSNPVRGTYDPRMEVYSPPYLFTTDASGNVVAAPRPSITGAPARIGYGATFQVQTPNATDVASVVLVRTAANTHGFDMDQRLVGLAFTRSSGSLTVTGPPAANVTPPGYYLLFLLNGRGVPSVARFVQVVANPANRPPKGTITNPSGSITVRAGDPVTFAGSGTDADGTVTRYSWVFPGATPAASTQAVPGAVTFAAAGTYVVSLTVTDDKGENDPSPPTRAITVVPSPVTATLVAPAAGSVVSGTQTVSMSATGTQGSSNTFTLSVDGAAAFTRTVAGTTASFAWDTRTVADGTHTLALRVRDATGATGIASASVTVANTAPVLQVFITSPTQGASVSGTNWVDIWAQGAIGTANTFSLTVGTAGTPVAEQTISGLHATLAWDTMRVNDGPQTITATVRDQGGRIASTSLTVDVRNGTHAPPPPPPSTLTASFTSPAANATVSGTQSVGMSVSGASAGSTTFRLSIDGAVVLVQTTPSTTATYAWDTTQVSNGSHTLGLAVTDASGATASASRTVTVSNTTTPPPPSTGSLGVFITSPSAGSTVSGGVWSDVWVEGAATGARTFTLSIGGTALATQTDAGAHVTMLWDSTRVADGSVTLTATVRDSAGRTGTATLSLTVRNGTTAPPPSTLRASFTSPAAGATVSGTQSVGMSVSGASGASNTFALALDGAPVFSQTTAATSTSWSWNTTTATNGPHSLTLTVTDAAGSRASASLAVTVSNATAPPPSTGTLAVFITSPAAGATVTGTGWSDVWVEGAAAGTNTFTLTVAGRVVATQSGATPHVTLAWDSTTVANGAQRITATVRDAAGNTGSAGIDVSVQNP